MTEQSGGSPSGFDFAAVSRGAWVWGVGALVLLLSVFFSWYTGKVTVSGGISGALGNLGALANQSKSVSGWSSTDVAKLVFLLALIALVVLALELFAESVELPAGGAVIAMALLVTDTSDKRVIEV